MHPIIVGRHPSITELLQKAARLAETDLPILITGEPGTGKKLLSQFVHSKSRWAQTPFIVLNSPAMAADQLEQELIAHKSSGATFVLDRVDEMPWTLQAKLIAFLYDYSIRLIGNANSETVRARIICTTQVNLEACMERGEFRKDLFYRVSSISLRVPPVRERLTDIPSLAEHLLERLVSRGVCEPCCLSEKATRRLLEYGWPGNVAELQSVLSMTTAVCKATLIRVEDLPPPLRLQSFKPKVPEQHLTDGFNLEQAVEEFENRLIEEAMRKVHGNTSAAARLLGIKRTTLVAKLRQNQK